MPPAPASSTATPGSSSSVRSSAASAVRRSIATWTACSSGRSASTTRPFSLAASTMSPRRADRVRERPPAARRGARPAGATARRRRRSRRDVLDRRRPLADLPDAAERRHARRTAHSRGRHGAQPCWSWRPTAAGRARSAGTSPRQYSRPFAPFFPEGSVGHTGFTGTAVWIDPSTKSYLIILVQPRASQRRRRREIRDLRVRLAAAAGAQLFQPPVIADPGPTSGPAADGPVNDNRPPDDDRARPTASSRGSTCSSTSGSRCSRDIRSVS